MKSTAALIAVLCLASIPLCAETWEERAAKRFTEPFTDEMKQKIIASIPDKPLAEPKQARKILVMSRCEGFIHTSIPHGKFMLEKLGEKSGAFTVEFNDDYTAFTPENLASFDAILFNNTTHLKPNDEQKAAIMDFIKGGKGVIGIHAATDNFSGWQEGLCMMGGCFDGHPWGAKGTWAFKLDDAKHPVNKPFGGKGFWHQDEIYQYKPNSYQGTDNLRILVSIDMNHEETRKPLMRRLNKENQRSKSKGEPTLTEEQMVEVAKLRHVPVSWVRNFGEGRLFYTNFGHNEATFWNPKINEHMLNGIQFALGDLSADATPTAKASDLEVALAAEKPAGASDKK